MLFSQNDFLAGQAEGHDVGTKPNQEKEAKKQGSPEPSAPAQGFYMLSFTRRHDGD
jgi:hypothetical protein